MFISVKKEMAKSGGQLLPTKYLGITSPISTSYPGDNDLRLTKVLMDALKGENIFENCDELYHRMEALSKLNEVVMTWIEEVNFKNRIPKDFAKKCHAKLLAFGSFRLNTYLKGADIDILCVASRHVTREDFFFNFTLFLEKQPNFSNIMTVPYAFVPVVRVSYKNVDIDIVFARSDLKSIKMNEDLRDDNFLKNMDITCVRSVNGFLVTDEIYRNVPNLETFQLAVKCIKHWAKKRGIYSNVLGYLGGVSWSILVARVCQLYPNACAATILNKFFLIYKMWTWPKPILLKQPTENKLKFVVWNPVRNEADRKDLMPIITPAYPHRNSSYNVTWSARNIIQRQIENGFIVTNDIMSGKSTWENFFEPLNFFTLYKHFLIVIATSRSTKHHLQWCGLIESRIRHLLLGIEKLPCVSIIHINPKTLTAKDPPKSSDQSLWLIGLEFQREQKINVDLTYDIWSFTKKVKEQGVSYTWFECGMEVEVKHVRRKNLRDYLPARILGEMKNKDHRTSTQIVVSKKRPRNCNDLRMKRKYS